MSEEEKSPKTIQTQIFEEMICDVKKHPEFNEELVNKIKGLYETDGLKKSSKIIEAIIPGQET